MVQSRRMAIFPCQHYLARVFGAEESHWTGSVDFLISDSPSHVTEQLAAAALESSVVIRLLKNRSPACLPVSE